MYIPDKCSCGEHGDWVHLYTGKCSCGEHGDWVHLYTGNCSNKDQMQDTPCSFYTNNPKSYLNNL